MKQERLFLEPQEGEADILNHLRNFNKKILMDKIHTDKVKYSSAWSFVIRQQQATTHPVIVLYGK